MKKEKNIDLTVDKKFRKRLIDWMKLLKVGVITLSILLSIDILLNIIRDLIILFGGKL